VGVKKPPLAAYLNQTLGSRLDSTGASSLPEVYPKIKKYVKIKNDCTTGDIRLPNRILLSKEDVGVK
jgi:hypothetical protein